MEQGFERVFNNSNVSVDSTLTSSELREFNDVLSDIVWVLKLDGRSKGRDVRIYATCFCIDGSGLILTSAHLFEKLSIRKIQVRRLNEPNFPHEATIMKMRKAWDLALLKVEGVSDCSFGRLAVDGSLKVGQTLLHIGHPENFVASFVVGRVAYPCSENVNINPSHLVCSNYHSTALAVTPDYRIMGDIWNTEAFEKEGSQVSWVYEKNLDPMLPVIQCVGFSCKEGCSGGPVFNTKGEIVGMLAMCADRYEIAVHVTALRVFLREEPDCSNEKDLKREIGSDPTGQGSSKRSKRGTTKGKNTHG